MRSWSWNRRERKSWTSGIWFLAPKLDSTAQADDLAKTHGRWTSHIHHDNSGRSANQHSYATDPALDAMDLTRTHGLLVATGGALDTVASDRRHPDREEEAKVDLERPVNADIIGVSFSHEWVGNEQGWFLPVL
jgi:hypothetical protein